MVRTLLLAAASALALSACGQSTTTTADAPPMETPAAPTSAAMADPDFVQLVAGSDAFEIQSSQLAAQHAARQDVKDFAAMMVRDHTATTQELTSLAPSLGMSAPAPTLTSDQQLKLDNLRTLNGEAFDDAYLDAQVDAHQSAVNAFQSYVSSSGAGPLHDWAQTTLPKLQTHLTNVQALENAT